MINANIIQKELMVFLKGAYDILLPNYFHGSFEMDLFRITDSDFVVEYEIKISRSDFFADFKKKHWNGNTKHDGMTAGTLNNCPNKFFFVTPKGLLKKEEIPVHAGLIEYDGVSFSYITFIYELQCFLSLPTCIRKDYNHFVFISLLPHILHIPSHICACSTTTKTNNQFLFDHFLIKIIYLTGIFQTKYPTLNLKRTLLCKLLPFVSYLRSILCLDPNTYF
jgi:hypothetical protein